MSTINITFERALASLVETNPFQTIATFVFADDKPNDNNQILPFSEFERVAASAIGMPIKMRFTGFGTGNHAGSIPIGVIQHMEIETVSDDYHRLIAKAALWNQEFPEEIQWLKDRFAEGKAPGLSYEINYRDFERDNNNEIIKETYTGAATFVRNPAYGTRTALLALASLQKTELEEGIIAIAKQLTTEGGNDMDEKELEALKAQLDTYKAEASSKQGEIESLTTRVGELEGLLTEKDNEVASLKNAALLDSRIRKYTEAGFALEAEAEKADKKKSVFASFSDEQFDEYLADLVAVKASQPAPAAAPADFSAMASASLRVPKLELPEDANITSLKQGMRSLARPNSTD